MRLFLALFLVAASSLPLHAAEPTERLQIAEAFMQKEEYYRAATLFMEAAVLTTDTTVAQKAWIRAADAHARANQFDKAAKLYRDAATMPAGLQDAALLGAGRSFYLAGLELPAVKTLAGYENVFTSSSLVDEAVSYRALSHLSNAQFVEASLEYRLLAERSTDPARASTWMALAEGARSVDDLSMKSPRLAAVLSLLLPGAGQVYAEHYGEAAMGFIANAVFGVLIWDSWLKGKDRNEAGLNRGWAYTSTAIYGFIGSSFYLGTAYGAAVSAQRYNKLQVDELRDALKVKTVRLQLLEVPLN